MLNRFRTRLAALDALPHLSLLAVFVGLFASVVAIALREVVEQGQHWLLPHGQVEAFELLPPLGQFLLPCAGGLLLALIWHHLPSAHRQTGIVYVIERLSYYQGYLAWRNALMQFIGASICLISGQPLGREGPSVHLGAASGSLLAQWLKLPNNSVHTLIACGTAAAIAASFNTPLAGVIFAMEVVLLEYSVMSFTPVILSAGIGAVMTRLWYGNAPAFAVPSFTLSHNLVELFLWWPFMGAVIGVLAAVFIQLLQSVSRFSQPWPVSVRFVLAGCATGLMGVLLPPVLGIGYDTVNSALLGELTWALAVGLIVGKLLATAVALGLGLPAGLIGPTFVMGASTGHFMGLVATQWLPVGQASPIGFYSMLGIGAMMSAVLQAPLAGLTALLELTGNLHVIVPAMLVIVVANLVAHAPPFRKQSIFLEQLQARGLDHVHHPVAQSLRRIGVVHAMDKQFGVLAAQVTRHAAALMLARRPVWIVVEAEEGSRVLLQAADLARGLDASAEDATEDDVVDLLGIPAQRSQLLPIDRRATLQQGLALLQQQGGDALFVTDNPAQPQQVYGVLTQVMIEQNYLGFQRRR